jgi:hypothetical protein
VNLENSMSTPVNMMNATNAEGKRYLYLVWLLIVLCGLYGNNCDYDWVYYLFTCCFNSLITS